MAQSRHTTNPCRQALRHPSIRDTKSRILSLPTNCTSTTIAANEIHLPCLWIRRIKPRAGRLRHLPLLPYRVRRKRPILDTRGTASRLDCAWGAVGQPLCAGTARVVCRCAIEEHWLPLRGCGFGNYSAFCTNIGSRLNQKYRRVGTAKYAKQTEKGPTKIQDTDETDKTEAHG